MRYIIPTALICIYLTITSSLYSPSDDVIELTPSNFNQMVLGGDGVWMVEFYAPWCGHCKNLAPEWKKAASALKGVVSVGAVDMDKHSSLGGPYGISGFPTIKIFAADKNKPKDYQSARSAKAIIQTAMKEAGDLVQARIGGESQGSQGGQGGQEKGDVIELSDETFDKEVISSDDPWLVEFYAPWCGHCKNLAPIWAKAATSLKGKVKLGAVDATAHTNIASHYSIQGYPNIKFFPAGPKQRDSAQEYTGGRTMDDIVQWAMTRWSDSLPAPEVLQLLGQETMNKCLDDALCVISFLPNILDTGAKGRNEYIQILTELADKYKLRGWGWVWSEGGQTPDLEAALEIGGFGYPALAVVNARKARYAILRGSFNLDGIDELLRAISVGRGSTIPMGTELPNIPNVSPWDGKDGELMVDDYIDLSDFSWDDPPLADGKEEL